jgi:hypothetical protein
MMTTHPPSAGIVLHTGGPPADPASIGGDLRISTANWWLSGVLLLVTDVAAGLTAFGDMLSGPAVMMGSARGTALVLLLVTTPVMATAMFVTARGSARGLVVWLGAVAVTAYNTQMLLYATPFNSLFLLYVAMLGLSVWALGCLLRDRTMERFAARVDDRMPVRSIAVYLWVVAGMNALIWLRAIVPAVLSADPASALAGTGLTTNPVYVQDLALWLPLAVAAGVWLWRRRPAGFLITGALLALWVMESISIAVDQWFGHQADPTSPVAALSMVPVFAMLAVVGLLPLILHLRHLSHASTPRSSGDVQHRPAAGGADPA